MKAQVGHTHANRLALDLDVSRVSLAAIKAKTKTPLTEEEVSSAARLRDALRGQLAELRMPAQIPEELVPRGNMRHQLEEALGTLTSLDRLLPAEDPELLERLVRSLDKLVREGSLPEPEAAALLDDLLRVGVRSSEIPKPAEVDLVYADARAR